MSDERGRGRAPLRDALARMRAEVDDLIDRELTRLHAAGERPEAADRPPPPADPPGRALRPPPAPEAVEPTRDAGSRLDALARRLDGRLRQAPARPGGTGRREAEAPEPGPARGA